MGFPLPFNPGPSTITLGCFDKDAWQTEMEQLAVAGVTDKMVPAGIKVVGTTGSKDYCVNGLYICDPEVKFNEKAVYRQVGKPNSWVGMAGNGLWTFYVQPQVFTEVDYPVENIFGGVNGPTCTDCCLFPSQGMPLKFCRASGIYLCLECYKIRGQSFPFVESSKQSNFAQQLTSVRRWVQSTVTSVDVAKRVDVNTMKLIALSKSEFAKESQVAADAEKKQVVEALEQALPAVLVSSAQNEYSRIVNGYYTLQVVGDKIVYQKYGAENRGLAGIYICEDLDGAWRICDKEAMEGSTNANFYHSKPSRKMYHPYSVKQWQRGWSWAYKRLARKTISIERFPGPPQGSWSSGHEALAFQVDRRCQISGFGLYGHPDKDINVTIKILEGTSRDGSICLGEKTTEYKVTSKADPAEVLFDTPITVESGKDYCMVAHVKTSVSILRGSNGKGRVTGGGITFTFKNASGSNNGNSATSGQFPRVLFNVSEDENLAVSGPAWEYLQTGYISDKSCKLTVQGLSQETWDKLKNRVKQVQPQLDMIRRAYGKLITPHDIFAIETQIFSSAKKFDEGDLEKLIIDSVSKRRKMQKKELMHQQKQKREEEINSYLESKDAKTIAVQLALKAPEKKAYAALKVDLRSLVGLEPLKFFIEHRIADAVGRRANADDPLMRHILLTQPPNAGIGTGKRTSAKLLARLGNVFGVCQKLPAGLKEIPDLQSLVDQKGNIKVDRQTVYYIRDGDSTADPEEPLSSNILDVMHAHQSLCIFAGNKEKIDETYRPLAALQRKLPHDIHLPILTHQNLAQITKDLAYRWGYTISFGDLSLVSSGHIRSKFYTNSSGSDDANECGTTDPMTYIVKEKLVTKQNGVFVS